MSDVKAVRKHAAQHDLFNRLHSIAADERFVRVVASDWFENRFEVVPNQRCGTWYCDPSTSSKAYAYFKSTDGHTNNWNFNLRRSNLPFAVHAERRGGLILVDSTRRGKRMPDALSKTVPIWCAVINLALRLRREDDGEDGEPAENSQWDTALYLPPSIVSPSEKSQIQAQLAGWAAALETSTLPLPDLKKPLRPFFIHPATTSPPQIPDNAPFTPIICVSTSRWVGQGQEEIPTATRIGRSTVGFDYVPGAGDDDELWARKLKPSVYHANRDRLLAADRDELPDLVDEIVSDARELSLSGLSLTDNAAQAGPSAGPSRAGQGARVEEGSDAGSDTTESSLNSMIGITPVPIMASRLAVSLGEPVTPIQEDWEVAYEADVTCTFWIVLSNGVVPGMSRILPLMATPYDEDVAVAVPNPRTHPKEYSVMARDLIACVRKHHEQDHPIILRAISADALHLGNQSYNDAIDASEDGTVTRHDLIREFLLDTLTEENMILMRKLVIPLVVALLVAIPSLCPMDEYKDGDEIDKQVIADVLHRLVAMWPDSNPPRAALRRINGVLMSRE